MAQFNDGRIIVQSSRDCWDNTEEELKIVTECGRKPTANISIIISRVVKNKIDLLMKKFPHTEWLAYLLGDKDSRFVTDLYLPEQRVTGGDVTVTGSCDEPNVIGVIHSHHNMGAFFSGTDDTYINSNYDISIVVAHNGSKAQVRWVTPCGHKLIADGTVVVESENLFDADEFLKKVDDVVSEPVNITRVYSYAGGGYVADYTHGSNVENKENDTTTKEDDNLGMDNKYSCLRPSRYSKGVVRRVPAL